MMTHGRMNLNWISWNVDIPDIGRAGLRRFGLVTGSLVAVVFGILLPWLWKGKPNFPAEVLAMEMPAWPWVICLVLNIWALIAPGSLRLPYRAWMRFALVLGAVNSRIILGIVFVFVFVPIGLFLRLAKGNPMMRSGPNGEFRISSPSRHPSHMEKPF